MRDSNLNDPFERPLTPFKKEKVKKTKVERKPDAGGPHPRQLKPPDMPEDVTISSGHMPTHSVL